MKCARPNCRNTGRPGRNRGLCHKHYDLAPLRGYVDSGPARERIALLRERGMTLKMLADAGISRFGVQGINTNPRIRKETQAKVFAIPVPGEVLTLAPVDSLGTIRRIQALMALGYRTSEIAAEIGTVQNAISAIFHRDKVTAETRAAVAALYERWHMTPGPSEITRQRAKRAGYLAPLAWEDIDDPDEKPVLVERHVSFAERLADAEFMNIRKSEYAQWMGIQAESVERGLQRKALKEAS